MPRSLFDQETEVHSSSVYDDSVAPTQAAYETNPVELQTDLNNLRSVTHELRDVRTSNWWAALTAPTTFTSDSPTARGVQNVNEDLWDLERKRFLNRRVVIGASVTPASAAAATEILTLTGNAADTETVTIDTKTYTFQTTLTDVDGNVLIGATASDSIDNLIAAITLGSGSGSTYAASTTLHPTVTAAAGAGDTMDATAKKSGTAGNSIATTETLGSGSWGAATMSGGAGDVAILDAAGELPGSTTMSVGTTTTLGTVCAYEVNFGTATLTEVVGENNIKPDNLCIIVDASTLDPILDGDGRQIYALLQSESNTDGHTASTSSPSQLQLTFVVRTTTGDDLEIVDAADIDGTAIDYAPYQQYALADLPRYALSGPDYIDVGAGSADRQGAYSNQGAVPANILTNSTLDLEAAGIFWKIRDNNEADLFTITEGSAGGTTDVTIGSDVDTYVNDALDVDFDQGVSINTGGSRPIDIGENDGVIESTAGALEVQATTTLSFDDGNKPAGWSLAEGIHLSDSAQEWTDFEAVFGEASLLDAIVQAREENAQSEEWAHVNADIAANTNITGAGGTPNITAQMPSYKGLDPLTPNHQVWLYINGKKQRPGANQAAGMDWYPHPTAANQATGDFYLTYKLKLRGGSRPPDNVNMVVFGTPDP